MLTIYGLANCDKTQAALKQFKARNTDYTFIDFKINPPTKAQITNWCAEKSWQLLLNKRSTTWKNLSIQIQETITDEVKAIELMVQHPTLLKRPIIEKDGKLMP